MIGRYLIVSLLIVTLALATVSPVWADVLLENRVDSATGSPTVSEFTFTTTGYRDFKLVIINGASDGSQRVSSAVIMLNGTKLLVPSDFNQNIPSIRRDLAPKDGINTLSVSLRSNPGSFLLVRVEGEMLLNLPPDPGPTGNITLNGVDTNSNGVRDDVERWIGLTYRNSEKMRQALTQSYYPIQNMLSNANNDNRDQVYNDMTTLQRANECLGYIMGGSIYKTQMALHAQILNTVARSQAYLKASKILGGGSFPKRPRGEWKNSCSFNPDTVPN